MITPSFNLTATERVLPKLALDFTTAVLDPRITFARTTGASNPATYVNSSGLVTAATNDQPRFDFNPVTLVCRGLLIEEQRTNRMLRSEEFNETAWVKVNATVTANIVTAPDGALTADKLVETIDNAQHRLDQTPTSSAGAQTFSVYAKAAERTFVFLRIGLSGACFSLSTGAVTEISAGFTATATAVGNGWYRCVISTDSAAANAICRINVQTQSAPAQGYTGDGTSGIYIWGAQLEAGAFATSYIPTTTTALTRNADVATMTGTNFSSWFNATEGTFVSTHTKNSNASGAYVYGMKNSTNTERIGLTQTASIIQPFDVSGGVAVFESSLGAATGNTKYTVAHTLKANNFAGAFNGGSTVTDLAGNMPSSIDTLVFGATGVSSVYLNGTIAKFNFYPQRLTNAEVQAFSKG